MIGPTSSFDSGGRNPYDSPANLPEDALCLETYGKHYLGFHCVPNTVLFDLVQTVLAEWQHGIHGISQAVSSVISDYTKVFVIFWEEFLFSQALRENPRFPRKLGVTFPRNAQIPGISMTEMGKGNNSYGIS